jgi:deoxyribonuclease V
MPIRIPSRISPRAAIALQRKLAPLVSETSDLPNKITSLVGCDATYLDGTTVAAATLVDYDNLALLKTKCVKERTRFPYIPGLLAFREGPAVLRAIRALRAKSYVCLVDAHGLAHPRKFGLACFVGVALNRPTIGVAKSLLFGSLQGKQVVDPDGYPVAELVPLPQSGKAVYVSVGHKVSLKDAVEIVKRCLSPRGPAPVIFAHDEVTKQKWQVKKSNLAS